MQMPFHKFKHSPRQTIDVCPVNHRQDVTPDSHNHLQRSQHTL
jgi:hypothetical protein